MKATKTEGKKGNNWTGLGYILAAAGSAVGLGNIWKFPTVAGQNGGGVFLLFYLLFVVILGIPLLLGEATIGRYTGKGPSDAYRAIAEESGLGKVGAKVWEIIGTVTAVIPFLIFCFYSVIAGWILQYCVKVFTLPISDMTMDVFGGMITETVTPIIYALIFIVVTALINLKGMMGGLEKAAKILMPTLVVMLIFCAGFALTLDGGMDGLKFLFIPDFSVVEEVGGLGVVALAALGQAFFSLSLGSGQMVTFGAYLNKDANLAKQTYGIPALDTAVALLAGVATLPAVFAVAAISGIDPTDNAGAGMLLSAFPQSLDIAFGSTLGSILTFVMLLLVVFAAITSTTGMLSVVSTLVNERLKIGEKKAIIYVSIAVAIGAVLCSLSYNDILGSITLINGLCIFDSIDYLTSNVLIPAGALLMCILIGYVWKADKAIVEITNEGKIKFGWAKAFKIAMMVVNPIIIIVVMLSGFGII